MPAFEQVEFWTAGDGARLALRREPATGGRRAALILVHGFGEHSGRYAHVAQWFAARGVAVYALDQRGHGRSPGPRGHIARFAQYLSDVVALRKLVASEAPGPLLLLGHSFGGLVVLRYLESAPAGVTGAIVSCPFLAVAFKVPAWKVLIGKTLADVLPSLPFPTGINPDHLSHDAEVVRAAVSDPLCHTVMTPRAYREIMAAQQHALAERERIAVPLFFGVAGDDRVVSRLDTQRFAGSLTGDVTVRVYDGMFHEIFNEPGREAVFADLAPWLERVLDGREATRAS
jgi:alpha-beta hydrolase superfamily lysophospholipase